MLYYSTNMLIELQKAIISWAVLGTINLRLMTARTFGSRACGLRLTGELNFQIP